MRTLLSPPQLHYLPFWARVTSEIWSLSWKFPIKMLYTYIYTHKHIYTHIHICMYINIDSNLYMQSHFSHVRLFVTQRTIDSQAHLSMSFSRQKWSPCPAPGIFPTQGSNPYLLHLLIGRQVLYH